MNDITIVIKTKIRGSENQLSKIMEKRVLLTQSEHLQRGFYSNQEILKVYPFRWADGEDRIELPSGSCYHQSLKTVSQDCRIARAFTNDNFYGFSDSDIVRYGVRWIELAAANPILHCLVSYYVEGDRGHLLN